MCVVHVGDYDKKGNEWRRAYPLNGAIVDRTYRTSRPSRYYT